MEAADSVENLRAAHRSCNGRRGASMQISGCGRGRRARDVLGVQRQTWAPSGPLPRQKSPKRKQQTGPTEKNSVCLSSAASRASRRVGVLWGFGRNSGCRASGGHHTPLCDSCCDRRLTCSRTFTHGLDITRRGGPRPPRLGRSRSSPRGLLPHEGLPSQLSPEPMLAKRILTSERSAAALIPA
jgi:hypothetical protein